VDIADLNLVRPGDAAILHERIVEAAWTICARPHPRTVLDGADRQRCFRGAVQRAVNRLDQPTLTLAHRQKFAWADRPSRRAIRLARA
jgi:UrcA family protein